MADDKKKKRKQPVSVLDESLTATFDHQPVARNSYGPASARANQAAPQNRRPITSRDPMFNQKIDRLDRETDLRTAIRYGTPSSRPGLSAALNYYGPGMESVIVREGEYNPDAIPAEKLTDFDEDQVAYQNKLETQTADEAKVDAVDEVTNLEDLYNPMAGGSLDAALEADLDWALAEDDKRILMEDPPVKSLKGQTDRMNFVVSNYPLLARGLAEGAYSDREMRETVNFAVAFDAAALLNNSMMQDEQAKAFFGRMSPAQQLLVRDIAMAWAEETASRSPADMPMTAGDKFTMIEDAKADASEAFSGDVFAPAGYIPSQIAERQARSEIISEESTGNSVKDSARQFWNWTAGWAFDILFNQTNEFLQQGVRAASLAVDTANIPTTTDMGFNVPWSQVWSAARLGSLDPEMVNEISLKYGKRKTEIAAELMAADMEGDPTVLPEIQLELSQAVAAGDEEARELLVWLGNTIWAGSDMYEESMQVFDELQLARTGQTGNILFTGLNGQPTPEDRLAVGQSSTYQFTTTAGQIAGYTLDPLLLAGPLKAAQTAKYGIRALTYAEARGVTRAEAMGEMFKQRAVQNAFNSLGDDLRQIEGADAGFRGQIRKGVEARWKRYFTPQALDDMRTYMRELGEDGYTPDAFLEYFQEGENLSALIVGQHARRARQVVVPHMTTASVWAKKAAGKARGLTYTKGSAYEYLDEIIGPGYAKGMPEDGAEALARALDNASDTDEIARVLGDFVWADGNMVRTVAGRVLGAATAGKAKRWGWKSKGTKFVSRRWLERVRRVGSRMPMNSGPVATDTGRDAARIGDLLEWSGMPRHFARGVELIWADKGTTQEMRTRMLGGIIDQVFKARGIDQTAGGQAAMRRFAGDARDDIYSPDFFDVTGEAEVIRQQVAAQVEQALAAERAARFSAMGRDTYQVGDGVWRFDKKTKKWVEDTVTTVTNRGGVRLNSNARKTINQDLILPRRIKGEAQPAAELTPPPAVADEAAAAAPAPAAAPAQAAKLRFPSGDAVVDSTGRYYLTRSNNQEWTVSLLDEEGDLVESLGVHRTKKAAIEEAQAHADEAAAASTVDEVDSSYRMTHQSPGPESGTSVDNMEAVYPNFYARSDLYSTGDEVSDAESLRVINSVIGNPEATVTIYRSLPPDVPQVINPGDWVSLSKNYAKEHGMDAVDEAADWPVISREVPAREVYNNGDSINEWGWTPSAADEVAPTSSRTRLEDITVDVRMSWNYLHDARGRDLIDIDIPPLSGRGTTVSVPLNKAQLEELLDDVRFYLDEDGPLGDEFYGDAAFRRAQRKSLEGVERKILAARTKLAQRQAEAADEIIRRAAEPESVADEVAPAAAPVAKPEPVVFAKPGPELDLNTRRTTQAMIAELRDSPDSVRLNASEVGNGQRYAVTWTQMTDQMAFPNVAALDRYARRASIWGAVMGNTEAVSRVTDYWTLGTLAGPRFQVRSGIEDVGFYLLTGGELGSVTTGRAMSQAIRKSSMRTKGSTRKTSKRHPNELEDGTLVPDEPDLPQKLGTVDTLWKKTVGFISRQLFRRPDDPRADAMNHFLVAQATPEELRLADEAAKAGDRMALARLAGKVFLRQRMAGHPVFGWMAKGGPESKLSPQQAEEMGWLEDAVYFNDTMRAMDEVSEAAAQLFDGAPIGGYAAGDNIPLGTVYWDAQDEVYKRRVRVNDNWISTPLEGSPDHHRAWWLSIAQAMPAADGPKATAALSRFKRYMDAVKANDLATQNEIIAEVAEAIKLADATTEWKYLSRSALGGQGADVLARATMMNLRAILTNRNGEIIWPLYDKIKYTVDVDGVARTRFGVKRQSVRQNADGVDEPYTEYLLDYQWLMADLPQGMKPAHVLTNTGETAGKEMKPTISGTAWGMMGRSLARMTREPIFMGQYIEARRLLKPLQKQKEDSLLALRDDNGVPMYTPEEASLEARKWADSVASERAMHSTLDYVDNPAIRTQLAWEARNVARFYRALEDFFRRSMRTVRNHPTALVKAGVAWRVVDNSGFFWEDEYGEKYFIWPGSQLVFKGVNWFLNNVVDRGGIYTNDLPAAFSSGVTQLSPSTDPNAIFPTFSGWFSTVTVMPLVYGLKGLTGIDLTQELMGEYALDDVNPIYAGMPPHVIKAASLFSASNNQFFDDPDSVRERLSATGKANPLEYAYVNAAMSAIQAAGAAGWWDESKPFEEQGFTKEDLARRIDRAATWMMGLKAVLSPVVPAAMKIEDLSASDFARSLGYTDLRSEYIQLLKTTGDPDQATVIWMQMYPDGKSPFVATVSRSSGSPAGKGSWVSFSETADFIEEHQEIANENPYGLSFFAPQKGTTTLRGLETLKVNDLIPRGQPLVFLERVLTAQADLVTEQNKRLYLADRFNGQVKPEVWTATKRKLMQQFPNATEREITTNANDDIEYLPGETMYDYMNVPMMLRAGEALEEKGAITSERDKTLMELLRTTEEMYKGLFPRQEFSKAYDDYREGERQYWNAVLRDVGTRYKDDRGMMSALREMTLHLDFSWPTEIEGAN